MRGHVLIALSLGLTSPLAAQVDPQRADSFFKQAAAICQREGGRLWGVSLCGPMVIADARTGTIATSQPPPAAERPRGGVCAWAGRRSAVFELLNVAKGGSCGTCG